MSPVHYQVEYALEPTEPFARVLRDYCARLTCRLETAVFKNRGELVSEASTPVSLGMARGSVGLIEVNFPSVTLASVLLDVVGARVLGRWVDCRVQPSAEHAGAFLRARGWTAWPELGFEANGLRYLTSLRVTRTLSEGPAARMARSR
jgi:hypothetical protein